MSFHNFEHSSLPTFFMKRKRKAIGKTTTCETFMILCSSITSHPLTCPKTWGKKPKRLKIPEIDHFS